MTASETPITGETWGDEVESVRSFLLSESMRPLPELRPTVEAARTLLVESLEDVTHAQATFRPGDGEGEDAFGIAEVLRHVISIEAIFAERIRQLGLGLPLNVTKTYPGYIEGVEDTDTRSRAELLAAFEASGRAMRAAIDAIDGHEVLDTSDSHRLFGALNCRGWFRLHGIHLLDHAHQVQKLKANPGYPAA